LSSVSTVMAMLCSKKSSVAASAQADKAAPDGGGKRLD
jgi:hypothetical protein